jgi:tripartite-type tricarboxylate transporter receptor subunit TctC
MGRLLAICLAAALLAPTSARSNADYPNRPVKIIVNARRRRVDTATRIVADKRAHGWASRS